MLDRSKIGCPGLGLRSRDFEQPLLVPSVGGEKQVTNYFELFDYDINLITKAFQSAQ